MTIKREEFLIKLNKIFITGTGTNVGKTIVTSLLVHLLRNQNLSVIPYKPIQTGAIFKENQWKSSDVAMYETINHLDSSLDYCTYLLKKSCSPHLAAQVENINFDISKIDNTIENFLVNNDLVIIEGAGGLYVPITTNDFCMIDWMKQLSAPTIIVATAGIGTINHTVLSVKALQEMNIPILGIIINNIDGTKADIVLDNQLMIERLCQVPIIGTIPYFKQISCLLTQPTHIKLIYENWNKKLLLEAIKHERRAIIGEK